MTAARQSTALPYNSSRARASSACRVRAGRRRSRLGVAASPRVASGYAVPKGGGVYKVGKPYQVAGRLVRAARGGALRPVGHGLLVRRRLPWPAHGQRRDLRHERADGRAPDVAAAVLCLRHQPRQRAHDPGARQRPRSLRRQPPHRPVAPLRRRARLQAARAGARARALSRAVRRSTATTLAERRHLAQQPWYRGNLNVAQVETSNISTGTIADPATTASWTLAAYRQRMLAASRGDAAPAALGGPEPTASRHRAVSNRERRRSVCATRCKIPARS